MTDPSTTEPPARSFLYVPGDQPDMLAKASSRGADALIIDLEDAVSPESKATARETVGRWLAEAQPPLPQLWVRVNAIAPLRDDDLEAVVGPQLGGIYLPKVASPGEVEEVAALLESFEAGKGVEPRQIRIAPLLESAAGILAATDIAHGPRVSHLSIGEEDLAANLGMHPSGDRRELMPMRTQVVLASAAAEINPPIGPVEINYRDLDALRISSDGLRRMGYGGRTAIHPAQIPVINEAFTPTAEEVAAARAVVEQFELMQQDGSGVGVHEGMMIDLAVVQRARRTLAAARDD
jgi:citrate lyase subunit beta/citryl-CoA lyase